MIYPFGNALFIRYAVTFPLPEPSLAVPVAYRYLLAYKFTYRTGTQCLPTGTATGTYIDS